MNKTKWSLKDSSWLRALAACPQFIDWLQLDSSIRKDSLRVTLATVISVINGTHVSIERGPYAPADVMVALKRLGWAIPPGEQDAHELFHVLLTSLDEETPKLARMSGCLSDALGLNSIDSNDPDSDNSDSMDIDGSSSVLSLSDLTTSITSEDGHIGRPKTLKWRSGLNRRHRWISRSCRSLRLSGPPTPQIISHPFCGTLTSQLKCTECGYKSVVRYDKFESLSLPLPSGMGDLGWGRHKLHQLLSNFTTAEVVNDVSCEGCNRGRDSSLPPIQSKQMKIQQFGKLPVCLCIHISRNIWHATGKMSKRQDYVQFPIRLSLSAYTFLQAQFLTRYFGSTSEGGSPLSYSMPSSWGTQQHIDNSQEWRHLYQLAAVVVHIGDALSGHFATYRRGHHTTTSKWFYTSDTEIREASMDEVLRSTAYMLFYEKCLPIGTF
ncbi:Ubiquitin specific protease 30 [Carabus blaptoides fortunei]